MAEPNNARETHNALTWVGGYVRGCVNNQGLSDVTVSRFQVRPTDWFHEFEHAVATRLRGQGFVFTCPVCAAAQARSKAHECA